MSTARAANWVVHRLKPDDGQGDAGDKDGKNRENANNQCSCREKESDWNAEDQNRAKDS